MTKKAAASATPPVIDPKAPEAPKPAEISNAEAAKLAKVKEGDIFAVNEYGNRYHVITNDGQKVVVEK